MFEQLKRKSTVRRAWPCFVLAVLASSMPWALVAATESGGADHTPLVSFAALFVGTAARSLLALDAFVAGGLPLLVLLAAVCCRRWWLAGAVVTVVLGVMAVIDLALFLGELPRDIVTDDVSSGAQPDFYASAGEPGIAMLAAVAYILAAVALAVGSRRSRRRLIP
ncbi:hypothetical protein [Planomonospora parontospora]|uniref:hypothetical protein n=1 Tax=Planomonospora parontospora TaxID=58119 RepID=UPI0016717073|nr:hypothetical protein [Planomonospora parontospora]